jgi:hypothetical protein
VNKKQSPVPVFLIYAGIIHAIGLALLMPMLITLPGPGSRGAPKTAAVDVEIIPASPSAAKVEQDADQTSALSAMPPSAAEDTRVEAPPGAEGPKAGSEPEPDAPSAVANVSPEAQPEGDTKPLAKTKSESAKPAKASTSRAAKKPVSARSSTAKPAARLSAKKQTKIAPFNGALSGLFSPGAPANRRR